MRHTNSNHILPPRQVCSLLSHIKVSRSLHSVQPHPHASSPYVSTSSEGFKDQSVSGMECSTAGTASGWGIIHLQSAKWLTSRSGTLGRSFGGRHRRTGGTTSSTCEADFVLEAEVFQIAPVKLKNSSWWCLSESTFYEKQFRRLRFHACNGRDILISVMTKSI